MEQFPSLGGYVKTYLVSDKFPLILSDENFHHGEMCYGFNKDFLLHLGGESSFQADHMSDYPTLDGKGRITWRKVDVARDGKLDLKASLFPEEQGDYAVVYAQFMVNSYQDRNVVLGVMSDDGIKIWHNRKMVLHSHMPRPPTIQDQDYAPVQLKEGWNQINIKCENSFGWWKLRVRFLEPDTLEPIYDLELKPAEGFTEIMTKIVKN